VLRWTRRGLLPAVKLPSGQLRYHSDQLDDWLERRATPERGDVTHPAGRRPLATLQVSPTPEDEE
jgi:hypothetical protein